MDDGYSQHPPLIVTMYLKMSGHWKKRYRFGT